MDYIMFGRLTAETKPNLFLYQFVDECITQFNLDQSKAELIYDLANASSIPQCHLISLTMLIGNGIIKRMPPCQAIHFLKSIGIEDHEMKLEETASISNVLLSWSGVVKCFIVAEHSKDLISQSAFIHIAYDAYEHELVLKRHFDSLLDAEKKIKQLESKLADATNSSELYAPKYEWDDFLCQMVRVDSI